ncbi:MAG: hypothetical protein AB1442_08960 [Nitrospirota bacterium]
MKSKRKKRTVMEKKKNIGELLIEFGMITRDDLEEGLRRQKEFNLRLGETLIKLGKITRNDIDWVLSKQLGIPFVIVDDITPDACLLLKFSRDFLLKNRILPLYETEEEIAVATDDPLNKEAMDSVEAASKKRARLSTANGERIEEILKDFFRIERTPPLMDFLASVLNRIKDTSFYRIDFILGPRECRTSLFGFGILKNLSVLEDAYTKSQIFDSLASLAVPFLYDEYENENLLCLSVYPAVNTAATISYPAVVGLYGLIVPETPCFTDARTGGLFHVFQTYSPVYGYPFIATKRQSVGHDKTIFTVDSLPAGCGRCYVRTAVPGRCVSCGGKGCGQCNELGYTFTRQIDGFFYPDDISRLMDEVRAWQK